MSYIKITETEQVSELSFDEVENAVLIYGLGYGNSECYTSGVLPNGVITPITEPTLFTELTSFRKFIHYPVTSSEGFVDRSLYYANDCLAQGLPILFVPVDDELESDYKYKDINEENIARAIYEFIDNEKFDISDKINCPVKFITTSGYITDNEDFSILPNRILELLGDRLDVIMLADIEAETNINTVIEKDVNFGEKASNVAIAYPWGHYTTYFDRSSIHMPGSYGQLMAFANSIKNNPSWMAAAGTTRGYIPNIESVDYRVTESLQRDWQGEVSTNERFQHSFRINPIMKLGSYGIVVFGNRTCYIPPIEQEGRLTKQQTFKMFLSVRLLLTEIHKVIHRVSLTHTFEPNDDILWLSYKQAINNTLEKMISGRGIEYYRWYKVKTQALSLLKAKLVIRPIETVEEFEINIHMTDQVVEALEGEEE